MLIVTCLIHKTCSFLFLHQSLVFTLSFFSHVTGKPELICSEDFSMAENLLTVVRC